MCALLLRVKYSNKESSTLLKQSGDQIVPYQLIKSGYATGCNMGMSSLSDMYTHLRAESDRVHIDIGQTMSAHVTTVMCHSPSTGKHQEAHNYRIIESHNQSSQA